MLEVKITSGHHHLEQLNHAESGILSALDRLGGAGLALYAATMRRLTDIGAAKRTTEQQIAELNRSLLKVRIRQEVLTRRAELARLTDDRKAMESEALEVTLGMHRKATGKDSVLE
jgi:hypothetical protein